MMIRFAWALCALSLMVGMSAQAASPDEYQPADAGQVTIQCKGWMVDVGPQILSCLRNAGSNYAQGYQNCRMSSGICYVNFDNLSKQLAWKTAGGLWQNNLCLTGEGNRWPDPGVKGTALMLAHDKFTDPNTVNSFIVTAAKDNPSGGNGGGNEGQHNCLSDFILITGNNPGVEPINFIGNNSSFIRNVHIGSGYPAPKQSAIRMNRYGPGPLLIQDVSVDQQFRWSINADQLDYGITIDGLSSNSPVRVWQNMIFGRGLAISRVPGSISANGPSIDVTRIGSVTDQWPLGAATVLDSQFDNVPSGTAAIYQDPPSGTPWFRAGILASNSGSSGAPLLNTQMASGTSNGLAWNSGITITSAFTTDDRAPLHLSFPVFPQIPDSVVSNMANWQKCTGCNSTDVADDAPAIAAAMAVGKPVVYVVAQTGGGQGPRRIKLLTQLNIPATTQVLNFEHGTVETISGAPIVVPANTGTTPLFITSGWLNGQTIKNLSDRPVIVMDSTLYELNQQGSGPMYGVNVSLQSVKVTAGKKFYGKQVDCESQSSALGCIENRGGIVKILGGHGESTAKTWAYTDGGGCTEVLGMSFYALGTNTSVPLFRTIDSKVFFGIVSETAYASNAYTIFHRETRGATTQDLSRDSARLASYKTNGGGHAAISGHQGSCTLQ